MSKHRKRFKLYPMIEPKPLNWLDIVMLIIGSIPCLFMALVSFTVAITAAEMHQRGNCGMFVILGIAMLYAFYFVLDEEDVTIRMARLLMRRHKP